MQPKVLAAYFRALRKGHLYTQQSLADTTGVGKRTVERLDRGDGPVSLKSLEPIMALFGTPPDDVNYLLTNPAATIHEAQQLAQALLQRSVTPQEGSGRRQRLDLDPRLRGVQTYVRIVREHQNISRKVLADMLGIGISALADWEEGRSTALPLSVVFRAITQLGGTLEDLKQIDLASEKHVALGRHLAEVRVNATFQDSRPEHGVSAQSHRGVSTEATIMQRIAAIEGIVHFVLSVLKRALPAEAPDIERIAVRWFQSTTGDETNGPLRNGQ